jgi:hypothetical protein
MLLAWPSPILSSAYAGKSCAILFMNTSRFKQSPFVYKTYTYP